MKSATVRVVEGESTLPPECNLLGTCTIDFPRAVEKGEAVEITYSYTKNQVLEVTVQACDRINRVQITRGANFSEAETAEATAELAQIQVS